MIFFYRLGDRDEKLSQRLENGVGKLFELWFAVRATRKPRSLRSVLTRIYLWGPERSRSVCRLQQALELPEEPHVDLGKCL